MKIEVIPGTIARALAHIEKMSAKIETEVLDMLRSLKDGEGATITVEEGYELNKMKFFVKRLAKTEGINISVRALERRRLIVIWKRK